MSTEFSFDRRSFQVPMLKNKTGIIFGVANKRSIAWATAQTLHEAGARLAFTYQGERLKENVEALTAETMPGSLLLPCDVTKHEEVDETFKRVAQEFGKLDFLIHSIAYAPREALGGEYLDTSREAFLTALEISAYSLVHLSKAATPADDRWRQHRLHELLRRREGSGRL